MLNTNTTVRIVLIHTDEIDLIQKEAVWILITFFLFIYSFLSWMVDIEAFTSFKLCMCVCVYMEYNIFPFP